MRGRSRRARGWSFGLLPGQDAVCPFRLTPIVLWCAGARRSVWWWRAAAETADCCLEHVRQNACFPSSPGTAGLIGSRMWRVGLDVVHEHVAALDVSKKDATVCVRVPGKGAFTTMVTTWGSTTNRLLALREHLMEQNVTLVISGDCPSSRSTG